MQHIAKNLPATNPSKQSTAVSNNLPKPNAEQLAVARDTLKNLLRGRPDTTAENPQYLAGMVECLAWLTPEEHAILAHPRTGLHTTLKFLPTPADVHAFLRERRERLDAVRPAPTHYRRLNDEPAGPWDEETDYERKRSVVREALGYNPDGNGGNTVSRSLTEPSPEEIASLRLKTPLAPATRQLKAKLEAEGWPFIPRDQNTTA